MRAKRRKPRSRTRLVRRVVTVRVLRPKEERLIQALLRQGDKLYQQRETLDFRIVMFRKRMESLCAAIASELARANLGILSPAIEEMSRRAKRET